MDMNKFKNQLKDVIKFWFEDLTQQDWWKKSDELDIDIAKRFGSLHKVAKEGKLESVRDSPEARLAELS